MGWREEAEARHKERKDLEESGLSGGPSLPKLPKWAWVAIILGVIAFVGTILEVLDSSPSKPKTRAPQGGSGFGSHNLSGGDPASGTVIDPINGFSSRDGGTPKCKYRHGDRVIVEETGPDRWRIEDAAGCESWVSKDFIK